MAASTAQASTKPAAKYNRQSASGRKSRLNPQQHRFCREFAYDVMGNATKAAIAAGYSRDSASVQASMLLNLPKVQEEIERLQVRKLQKMELLVAATVRELARIAYSDPRLLFDESGAMLPINELPDDLAHAIASIEVESSKRRGEDAATVTLTKVKFWSKTEALAMMGKYTGILKEAQADAGGPSKVEVEITYVTAKPAASQELADITVEQPRYGSAVVDVKLIEAPKASDSNTP